MTGSVLIAKVQRDRKRVELDGNVRPGMPIDAGPKTEVVILAMSTMGHLVDAAAVVARDLRARGWQVTVKPYKFASVEMVRTIPATASAMVGAVIGMPNLAGHAVAADADDPPDREDVADGDAPAEPVGKRPRKPMTRWTSRRFRCDDCGIEAVSAAMTMHQRRTGHTTGRTFIEAVVIDKTAQGTRRQDLTTKTPTPHPTGSNPNRRGEGVATG